MKIAPGIGTLALLALLAASQTAMAGEVWPTMNSAPDRTGMAALGTDVSRASNGPEGAKEFLHTLKPERQRGLVNGCRAMVASPYFADDGLLRFCKNLVSVSQNFPRAAPPPMLGSGG